MALRRRIEPEGEAVARQEAQGHDGHDELVLPHLGQFAPLDCFLVKQEIERFEAITGIETENSYQVLGARRNMPSFGPLLAKEKSGFITRMACGSRRPWTIRLGAAPHVLVVERPFKFLFQEIRVYSAPENLFLGTVRRICRGYPFQRNFDIRDRGGESVLQITCPFFSLGWNFTLWDMEGQHLGSISKKWAGVAQEMFTDADNFGCGFPADLPVEWKALVLGAVFLIDFCFFEDNEAQKSSGRRRLW